MDCRYCHASVEKSGTSSVPAAQTCMNCHSTIKTQSPLLEPVRSEDGRKLRGPEKSVAKKKAITARAVRDMEAWLAGA